MGILAAKSLWLVSLALLCARLRFGRLTILQLDEGPDQVSFRRWCGLDAGNGLELKPLCTTCVQNRGFEGPENGPKQRRINKQHLSYRPTLQVVQTIMRQLFAIIKVGDFR
jgi:hypothetical protein